MILKIVGVVAWVVLPLSALLWFNSNSQPYQRRYDVTLYKSLRIYLRDGVCALELLCMPTKTASRSEFGTSLSYDPTPQGRTLYLGTTKQGPYRVVWFTFPLWLSTMTLFLIGMIPVVRGPIRRAVRSIKGWCLECGYDLTGNRSGRCPECGSPWR